MSDRANTQILKAEVEFIEQRFKTPMQLSSGLIETITEARATVSVRCGGRTAEGRGSIYLSDLWAWPDPSLTHAERDAKLRERCVELAERLPSLGQTPAHPLELGLRLHESALHDAGPLPALAHSICAAPFDAAIHDAAGRALQCSAFDFYRDPVAIPLADALFPDGACRAIAATLQKPATALDGWWIANAHEDLDGTFATAIRERGMHRFKIKLLGKSATTDAARTAEVYQAARRHGVASPVLSCDSNEGNADAASVGQYLEELQAADTETFDALLYLEQPTSRDIVKSAYDWRPVTALKPILLDEGLTSTKLLPLAVEQGWRGLALKTCKGHSFTLVAAAWGHQHGLVLTMQDLTNPGLAAIHSFQMAAHLPIINGIELNSPQFTPQANEAWLPELAALFEPKDGMHRLNGPFVGLGLA